jgi:hypothetical protein
MLETRCPCHPQCELLPNVLPNLGPAARDRTQPAACGGNGAVSPTVAPTVPARPAPRRSVDPAHNDIHSHLMGFAPEMDYTPASPNDDATRGGMARLAARSAPPRRRRPPTARPFSARRRRLHDGHAVPAARDAGERRAGPHERARLRRHDDRQPRARLDAERAGRRSCTRRSRTTSPSRSSPATSSSPPAIRRTTTWRRWPTAA